MKNHVVLAVALVFVGAFVGTAAEEKRPEAQIARWSDLNGIEVRNPAGDHLGKIEDAVIDMKDGRVVYFALSHGETLGFGGKMFAVAPQAFGFSKLSDKIVGLDETKANLEKLAGFDTNRWPSQPAMHWGKKRDSKEPLAKDDEEVRKNLRRVSTLIGIRVKNRTNEDLGRIYDLPIDTAQFRVAYAALAYGGVARVGDKLFAVAWTTLKYDSPSLKPTDRAFLLQMSADDFKNADGFDTKNWPTKPDDKFRPAGAQK